MKTLILALFIPALLCLACKGKPKENNTHKDTKDLPLSQIKLPKGFRIAVYAHVDNARSMALGDKGTVFVGNREGNKVYALVDADNDGVAEKQYVIASGMHMPNGVAYRKGALYIAEVDKIWRTDDIENHLSAPDRPVLVSSNFPADEHHGWKYIAFGPDDKLYVPVGAPCNICDDNERDPRYASITRMNADGSGFEVFAHGIRNSVGFDWQPQTKELWFTENGRDNMGDDVPDDELNCAPKKDMNFGYPYCHAGDIPDPKYGSKHTCSEFTPPVQKLGAHVAALGMKFYTGAMFPAAYKNQLFIAEHGSWNRSVPDGYRIMLVRMNGNKPESYEVFAEGWLQNGQAWGRPVALLQLKDGSLLVSDDAANAVYRITYNG